MFRFALFFILMLGGLSSAAQLPETDWLPETQANEAVVEDGQLLLEETSWEQHGKIRWHQASRLERLQLPGMTESLLLAIEKHEQQYGPLLDFEEFQCIDGLAVEQLRIWRVLIRMEPNFKLKLVAEKEGKHQLLWRTRHILENQEGYSLSRQVDGRSFYAGSPWQQLFRYRYDGHPLQFAVVLERDPGEIPWQLSFALSGKGPGKSRWMIGDMRYGAGYGLTINTGFYAGKSSDPLLAIPLSSGLRPAASAAEWQRFRGVGLQFSIHPKVEYQLMLSYTRQHASLGEQLQDEDAEGTQRLYAAGLFRTATELKKWRQLGEFTAAQAIQWQHKKLVVGWSSVFHHWEYPFLPSNRPDQLYQFSGQKQWLNSLWWRGQWRNLSFYGEMALDAQLDRAWLVGWLWPLHKTFGIQGSLRHYGVAYQSPYAQSLSARALVQGESGKLAGFWWEPVRKWRIQALIDHYSWPWLRYQIDRPSAGNDKQVWVFYQQRKQAQWSLRLRTFETERNRSQEGPFVDPNKRWQLRLMYRFLPHPQCDIVLGYQQSQQLSPTPTRGYGFWQSIRWQAENKKLSIAAQMILFDTDTYDTRLYVSERDLRFASSMPVLSGEGQRWMVLSQYKLGKSWDVGLRFARLRYFDRDEVGSGLDLIHDWKRTEFKIQLLYIL